MRAGIVAALVALAGLGLAGSAGASDDCLAGGFYQVCLFDEHAVSTTGFGTYESSTNRLARVDADTPAGPVSAGVEQSRTAYAVCAFPCFSYEADGTSVHASRGSGADGTSASVGQGTTHSWYEGWGHTRTHRTAATVAHGPAAASAGQYGSSTDWTSGCANRAAVGSTVVPISDCQVGPLDTTLPQLMRTCLATPAGPVCGTFPDYPDETGLPFL